MHAYACDGDEFEEWAVREAIPLADGTTKLQQPNDLDQPLKSARERESKREQTRTRIGERWLSES